MSRFKLNRGLFLPADFSELGVRLRMGRNIESLRKFYSIDQADYAEGFNRDRHWIGRIERGTAKLDAVYLTAIARSLRCTPEELTDYDLSDRM